MQTAHLVLLPTPQRVHQTLLVGLVVEVLFEHIIGGDDNVCRCQVAWCHRCHFAATPSAAGLILTAVNHNFQRPCANTKPLHKNIHESIQTLLQFM